MDTPEEKESKEPESIFDVKKFSNDYKNRLKEEKGLDLVIDFFFIFSRFECALKASGFLKNNTNHAEPDWDAFIKKIGTVDYTSSPELVKAYKYIIDKKPKKQIVVDGRILWDDTASDHNPSVLIRRVRNNLFHGGKFNGNYNSEESRNRKLLESCITILNFWISMNEDVLNNFKKPIIDPYFEK